MMTHPEEMTQEEWDALTERQKRCLLEAQHEEFMAEMSAEQRARYEWENGS
jgi:hypothetical protein